MATRFDAAWDASNDALGAEMGESVVIGGVPITAVVDVAGASGQYSGMAVNSGVNFTVFLSRAQALALGGEKGVPGLQSKEVMRGAFKGRVGAVRDLGGAGAEIDVGALSSR
jgi:hypothetical protein